MANYYHEARAHAKNIKHMQDDNRRRAERRAEKAGVEVNVLAQPAPVVSSVHACVRRRALLSTETVSRPPRVSDGSCMLQAELPVNLLRIDGRSCLVAINGEQYEAVQSMDGMIPMNGQQDNLIDRFDGRALLDFYREPVTSKQTKVKTEDELELEEV